MKKFPWQQTGKVHEERMMKDLPKKGIDRPTSRVETTNAVLMKMEYK